MYCFVIFCFVLVFAETPLVVVFTFNNRLQSLQRLLHSVSESLPLVDPIDLHICCDDDANHSNRASVLFLESFIWKRGYFSFKVHEKNVGLTEQWLNCWDPQRDNRSNVVLLEDDLELSPHALSWLVSARARYEQDDSIIGFSFQRQTNCYHLHCESAHLSIPWSVSEFKYLLVGKSGYAPVRKHWQRFRDWFKHVSKDVNYRPFVANLLPSKKYEELLEKGFASSMWEMWLIRFCDLENLYTLYYHHVAELTLASHWVERGLHYTGPARRDFPRLMTPPISPLLPSRISIGWNGLVDGIALDHYEITNIVLHVSRILPRQPLITFVNFGFKSMIEHFLCNLQLNAPSILSQLTFVALDENVFAYLTCGKERWGYSVVAQASSLFLSNKLMLWNTVGYNLLMLHRTRTIRSLLEADLPLLMFEVDAFVRNGFVESFLSHDADVVGINENSNRTLYLNGGFLFLRNSTRTRAVWTRVISQFEASMEHVHGKGLDDYASPYNEQDELSDILNEGAYGVRAIVLDPDNFLSGEAFNDHRQSLIHNASVVLFTYAVGVRNKTLRAKKHGIWCYLDVELNICRC
jgi:hypothetical protein